MLEPSLFRSYKRALTIVIQQGITQFQAGNFDAASTTFRQCVDQGLQLDIALRYLGIIQQQQSDHATAITYFYRLTEITPNDPNAWNAVGTCHSNLSQLVEAEQCFHRAIKLAPKLAISYSNLGYVLFQSGEYSTSSKILKKAVKLDSGLARAWNNLGHVMVALNQYGEAARCYKRALKIDPLLPDALSGVIYANRSVCNWENIDRYEKRMLKQSAELTAKGLSTNITPFLSVFLNIDHATQIEILESYATNRENSQPLSIPARASKTTKIRIGYVSAAFRDHATSHLANAMFQHHNKSEFEIICYASARPDITVPSVQNIQQHCDDFVDLSALSDFQAAQRIQDDNIHILLDFDGYTELSRHGIFTYKPACVRVNYLGFPGSMGAKWNDYIIGDSIVTPKEWESSFTEFPVRMPHCYQVNSYHHLNTDDATNSRKALKLPEDAVVFCCFNIARKLEPTIFDSWARILAAVPRGVLWILADDQETKSNLRREAKARGIGAEKIIFARRIPVEQHLARQKHADLFLDTFFCTGHTTTSDALWAGLPVVTLKGNTFANCVASSIVSSAGLEECVCDTVEEYETLAIQLANNADARTRLADKLQASLPTSPMFDTQRYVVNLERAFKEMWANHDNQSHAAIDVTEE